MFRRIQLACAFLIAISTMVIFSPARATEMPGVTPTEIKIGGIFPFSGPASSIGQVGQGVVKFDRSGATQGPLECIGHRWYSIRSRLSPSWTLRRAASSVIPITAAISG